MYSVGKGKIALGTERGWVGFETDGMAHGVYVINFLIYNFRNPPKSKKRNSTDLKTLYI